MPILDPHFWGVQQPLARFYALWEWLPLSHKLMFLKAQVLQLTPDQRRALWLAVEQGDAAPEDD